MSKRDLLLEIGLEEIPARYVSGSIRQLSEKIEKWLVDNKIEFGAIRSFSTPRRLAVIVNDVAEKQADIHLEAKGPAKKIAIDENGNWTKAAIGFTKGQKMSVDDIYFKEINGVEYAHVKKFVEGEKTSSLLPQLEEIVTGLTFPKNMHWADLDLKYIRPIKWIVALFGTEIIPFTVANVSTGNLTKGHRFLGKEISIPSPGHYEELLLNQYVIADSEARKEKIVEQLKELEKKNDWLIPIDEDLLEEVNNLVEYPTALYGRFEEQFLDLPEEVLITTMREHQRYFPVKSKDGRLLPYFVTVRNGNEEYLENVAKGNEKVLRARLQDAAFFYSEDQKIEIADALKKLDAILYHEDIGTLAEKGKRVRALTNKLAEMLNFNEEERKVADRAAEICKFDLVTNMVNEFPELQGYMGEKYALQKGEDPLVALAINEHYMPRNAGDSVPSSNGGAVLAISDKLDTIVSIFSIGLIPSGSQDPYALRRQAAGIVHILLEKDWNIGIETLLQLSIDLVEEANFAKMSREELVRELVSFFKLRIKHDLQEKEIRHDIIDCLLDGKAGSVPSLLRKAEILQRKKDEPGFKEGIEALGRVINISRKAEKEQEIDPSLFENNEEQALYDAYVKLTGQLSEEISEDIYFDALMSLEPVIKQYFDKTMVMAEDEKVRNNRLQLMKELSFIIERFGNVNKLLVK